MSSSIYARTGDKGQTTLVDGTSTPKTSPRVEAYGTLDETNAQVGVVRALTDDHLLDGVLELLQHRLYNCSSNVATPPGAETVPPSVEESDVKFLEKAIDRFEERAGPIKGFVLPGGTRVAAALHVARTVCRRAERELWSLAAAEEVDSNVLVFVNRSSDLLFAAARYTNAVDGDGDVLWDRGLRGTEI